jgi:hypothetical protein
MVIIGIGDTAMSLHHRSSVPDNGLDFDADGRDIASTAAANIEADVAYISVFSIDHSQGR